MSDIINFTLSALINKIKKKELSSQEITKAYIERAEKSKDLNTYITTDFENAIKKAKELEKDLNSIFQFIEVLNKVDTKKVEPLTSIAETSLKLRGDEVKTKNIREQILKNSPDENKDFFVVPKVVE